MAPSSTGQGISAYKLLNKQLSAAVKHAGIVRLPDETISKLKTNLKNLRTNNEKFPGAAIAEIVFLLDEDSGICNRLETKLFGTILQALLQTAYSKTKERGLLLLAISLYNEHGNDDLEMAGERAAALGRDNLRLLLASLVDTVEHARSRRWIGLLLQQLLHRSEENIYVFESCTEDSKRKIGTMVVEERNEILRVILGQILKDLMDSGIPPENLWPVGTDPVIYSNFPPTTQTGNSWNRAFQSYVDGLFEMTHVPEGTGTLYFAHRVIAPPSEFLISGKSNIMLLIDDGVSICSLFNDSSFGGSLDFPFDLIADVALQEVIFESGKRVAVTPFDVVIKLRVDEEAACCINGKPITIEEIRILVSNEEQAETIIGDLLLMRSRSKASQTCDPINIGMLAPLEGTPSSDEIKPGMSSKASQAKENIIITAHESPMPCQDDKEGYESTVDEKRTKPSFQRNRDRISDLLQGDDSPISTTDVHLFTKVPNLIIPGGTEDICDPSRQSPEIKALSLDRASAVSNKIQSGVHHEIPQSLELPGQAKVQNDLSAPISGPPSEERGESTEDPISFLPPQVKEHAAPRNCPKIPGKIAKTDCSVSILKESNCAQRSDNRITESMPSRINADEKVLLTSKQVFKNHAMKSIKHKARIRERTSKEQTAENDASLVKSRCLKNSRKYGLNVEQTSQVIPTVLSKIAPVSTSKSLSSNDAAIWDVPVDSAEIETSERKEVSKAKIALRTKKDEVTQDAAVRKKINVKGKNRMAIKPQSTSVGVAQPEPMLRSKRKAAQTANSKLNESNSDGEVGDDIVRPKKDIAPRRSNNAFQGSKLVEGGGKPRLKRVRKGLPKMLPENKSKPEADTRTKRLVLGETAESNMDIPTREPLKSRYLETEVVLSHPNLEKGFRSQKRDAITLNILDDNAGFRDNNPMGMSLNLPKSGIEQGDETLRLAQRLSTLLEGIDKTEKSVRAIDQVSLQKTEKHSALWTRHRLDSCVLLDSENSSTDERDIHGVSASFSDSDREQSTLDTKTHITVLNGHLRNDLKNPNASAIQHPPKKANSTIIPKPAGEGGLRKYASAKGKKMQKSFYNEREMASMALEMNADKSPLPIPASHAKEFSPQIQIMSPNGLCPANFSTNKHDRLPLPRAQTPASPGPSLLERAEGASMLETSLTKKDNSNLILVDEHLARKTPFVRFGIKGAQNQGYSSNKAVPTLRNGVTEKSYQPVTETGEQPDMKRDRDEDRYEKQGVKVQRTQKISHENITPLHRGRAQGHLVDRDLVFVQQTVFGSQSSRVDLNGSPRAFTNTERCLKPQEVTNANYLDELNTEIDFANGRPAFSDGGVIINNIPHRKPARRDHERVSTMDPFLKKSDEGNPSRFTQRLQAGGLKQTINPPQGANNKEERKIDRLSLREDPEKTLVEELPIEFSLTEEMAREDTNESGFSSHQSDIGIADRACLEWGNALKPHYKGMRQTLVRLVDDIVRNFIDQESAIDDVLEDYHSSGTRLVEELLSEQKTHIQGTYDEVQSTMHKIVGLHRGAQKEILLGMSKMRASPVNNLEKEWIKSHQALQTLIRERGQIDQI